MNSGCYGNDISKVLVSIKAIDINECKEKVINGRKLNFFMRQQSIKKLNYNCHIRRKSR